MASLPHDEPRPPPSTPLSKGTYSPPTPSDIRGPCPMLNTLANHGYLPRDGRNVRASDITAALHDVVGVSTAVSAIFTHPIFFAHREPDPETSSRPWWRKACHRLLSGPSALLFRFGMRRADQRDAVTGKRCLDLDQLAQPGAIEHDISLTRRDRLQGDCVTAQPDLVRDLLAAASSDGGRALSAADLAGLRRRRIAVQREANAGVVYGRMQHAFACMEIALFLDVFGDGEKADTGFARAFFEEERLPVPEGWARRPWWKRVGFLELGITAAKVRKLVGVVS